jgi:hypothetical protein
MIRRNRFSLISLYFSLIFTVPVLAAGPADTGKWATCECEESSCGVCQVETGVTFYSAKCGVQNTKVKSCKKPTCEAVENQKECLALFDKTEKVPEREPASKAAMNAGENSLSGVLAGEVISVAGTAKIVRASGPVEHPSEHMHIYNGDQVETKANGKVKIRLRDSSDMIVAANSIVKIESVRVDEKAGTRNVMLNLLTGKVRNRVQKKYEGGNSFEIKTRTAVAGVRGTDFVASYEPGEKEWVSEIRTFNGMVHLEAAKRDAADTRPGKSVDIPAGTYASLVIGPPSRSDDEEEFFKSLEQAVVTPVQKMGDDELSALDDATEFHVAQNTAQPAKRTVSNIDSDELCTAPNGRFNQCSFTCEGNPKGEKRCRTDLTNVSCVRKLCRASGLWSEPTRLPASQSTQCLPSQTVVGDCGPYW